MGCLTKIPLLMIATGVDSSCFRRICSFASVRSSRTSCYTCQVFEVHKLIQAQFWLCLGIRSLYFRTLFQLEFTITTDFWQSKRYTVASSVKGTNNRGHGTPLSSGNWWMESHSLRLQIPFYEWRRCFFDVSRRPYQRANSLLFGL